MAVNVIPGTLRARFNLRYSPALTAEQIRTHVQERLAAQGLEHEIEWVHGAEPYAAGGEQRDRVLEDVVPAHVVLDVVEEERGVRCTERRRAG